METPEYLRPLLAKSDGEALFVHTWNVLSRFADQARLRPDIADRIGMPRLWHQLFWACMLHDFGKAATGFQAMLQSQGRERWGYRHEVGSLAFLGWLFPDSRSAEYRWIVAAIVSHHKDAATIIADYKDGSPAIHTIAEQLAAAPLESLWQWLHDYAHVWRTQLGLDEFAIDLPALLPIEQATSLVRSHGTAQIEQALKVYRRLISELPINPTLRKQATSTLALRGLMITADHSASAHIGPPPTLISTHYTDIVQQLGWSSETLYAHQRASAEIPDHVVLIAPTGSGKTEAALFWTFGTGSQVVPRLFYALPFQASMNAMHYRLNQLFPDHVGLQHGRTLQALYRVFIEEGDDPRSAMQQAYDKKNRTELNYYPVRIFSPYQMLKACYKLRGYEAILSDYFGAAFIFDEIHAYEPKRLALILTLMAHLRQHYHARFFVMSATFPDMIQTALQQALGDYTEIRADPALFTRFQRHRLHLLDGDMLDHRNVQRICDVAQTGKSVLVCCNTIARAQAMWQAIQDQLDAGTTIVLLHSRLNGRDRLRREHQVMQACGLTSEQRHPVVLVATQVVEVSLNIDLDTIFSDLAPLEALVQRFGRVNRGRKQCDEHGNRVLADVHVFREPIPEKDLRPYDLRLLHGTLRLLEEQQGHPIDEQAISGWLNTIYNDYAGNYAGEWQQTYQQAADDFAAHVLRSLYAFNADNELAAQFYATFDSIEVLPHTFEQEYIGLLNQGRFVEANELLVTIAYWQYAMLMHKGKIRRGDKTSTDASERVNVVLTRYDEVMGLLFDE